MMHSSWRGFGFAPPTLNTNISKGIFIFTEDTRDDVLRSVFEGQPLTGGVEEGGSLLGVPKFLSDDKFAGVQ